MPLYKTIYTKLTHIMAETTLCWYWSVQGAHNGTSLLWCQVVRTGDGTSGAKRWQRGWLNKPSLYICMYILIDRWILKFKNWFTLFLNSNYHKKLERLNKITTWNTGNTSQGRWVVMQQATSQQIPAVSSLITYGTTGNIYALRLLCQGWISSGLIRILPLTAGCRWILQYFKIYYKVFTITWHNY